MIKKLLILIICAVMFSACERQPVSSTIENESNSTKKHYSFVEITQQVTMDDFEDWDKYDYSNMFLDKDNISLRCYMPADQPYGQWTDWIICRYENDIMTHRLELTEEFFSATDTDGYSIRPHTYSVYEQTNDNLTTLTLTDFYTDHCRLFIDFENEVVEYTVVNAIDEYTTLSEMDENQLEQTVMDDYLQPLINAGMIGHYYKDINAVDKMLAYFANQVVLAEPYAIPVKFTQDKENGGVNVNIDLVKEYLGLKFRDVDRYSFEENPAYNAERNWLNIQYKDTMAENVDINITEIDLDETFMWITYDVLDKDGNAASNETAFFHKRHGRYLFSGAMTDYGKSIEGEPKSGDYTFEELAGEGAGDGWWKEMALVNTKTGRKKSIGRITSSNSTDYGFFLNGDVYITDQYAFRAYDRDMSNPDPIFTTEKNFPAGRDTDLDGKGTHRYIYAVRRENADKYLVVYSQYHMDDDWESNFTDYSHTVLKHCYKVGLLDSSGTLLKSWDTDINVGYGMGSNGISIKKVKDNYFEIYSTYKYEEGMRFGFDISTGKLTHIKNRFSE